MLCGPSCSCRKCIAHFVMKMLNWERISACSINPLIYIFLIRWTMTRQDRHNTYLHIYPWKPQNHKILNLTSKNLLSSYPHPQLKSSWYLKAAGWGSVSFLSGCNLRPHIQEYLDHSNELYGGQRTNLSRFGRWGSLGRSWGGSEYDQNTRTKN